jgi:putative PEP-CTERM system TPR-repeat lipoprotein
MPRRVSNRALSASVVLTTLMLAAGLSGCGKTESSASLMAEAKQYEQKGDNKAALIQLKNAATKSPEDAEVRIQLAVLYNQIGDPVSAEKEIRKAISLGADNARAAPELAKALLQQGQGQKALDASSAAAAKAGPELLAVRGNAFLSLNQLDQAKEAYQQALIAKPGYAEAMLGMARLAMIGKDAAASTALTEQAIAANPKDPAVYFFKGSLLRAQGGKSDDAIAAFSQAIALKPDHVAALVERANLQIGTKKFDAAKADLVAAKKLAPGSLQVLYTQALLDFTQEKFAAANESLQKLLSAAPEHMPTLLLAGATELNLGTLKQSEQHLKKYVEKAPDNAYARKLLAQAQLKSAEPLDAAATLAPLIKDSTQDAQLLALAGEAAMQSRDFAKASQYFEKATTLSPDTAVLHTSLGLAKLGAGDREKAVAELERATTLDPKLESAGVALVRTELGLKQVDKAVASVKTLVAAKPESAAVQNLAGGVYLSKGDRTAARASFEKAATLEPTLFSPVMNLAQLDMDDKKPDAARQRLVAFLAKDTKNSNAMAALAALEMNQKRPQEATVWLEKANAENPEAVGPATQLANHYLRTNQAPKALTLIRKLQIANPADANLLDLLGQTQLANKDPSGALDTFSKLASVMPKSAAPQIRLATAHVQLKNPQAATDDLKKALALDPNFTAAKLGLIDLAMAKGDTNQALQLARQIQKTDPVAPIGYVLEGDLWMRMNKPEQAIRPYDQAFSIAKSPALLIKAVAALKAAGKGKDADAKMADWQKAHPGDSLGALYAGESALEKKQYKPAADQFEAVLKASPDNLAALNNLAFAYQEINDPRAIATAERALQIAPDNANVMDTLGWMLVQQGKLERGLPLLQKAVALQPAVAELRFHLAVALNKSGDKKSARQELDKLVSSNKPFPQMDEAKAMLKIL